MPRRSRSAKRASVPIPPAVAEAARRPERVGLPKAASAAPVYSRVMAIGWRYALDSDIGKADLSAYAASAEDPAASQAVLLPQRTAVKGRLPRRPPTPPP